MSLTRYTLISVAGTLVKPMSLSILILIGIVFYRQNKKITAMQKMVVGKSLNSPLELTISQIVIGIFGAVLASLLIGYLGIAFKEESMVELIFIISIIFMFLKPRFICFSYSGALLGLISLIFKELSIILNNPSLDIFKIDIIALMSLVAVLHFVEGIMIIIDGKRAAIPVFSNKEGKISGGFVLKRYWLLPVALLFIMSSGTLGGMNGLSPINFQNIIVGTTTFYGVIGYETITFTKTREQKVVSSGICVITYSLLLFFVCQLCTDNILQLLFLIVFAPLGHELMIFMQRHSEAKSKCIYVSNDEGMMVLEVAPDSLAYNMGIRSGDLLMDINDKKIEDESDIVDVIRDAPNYIRLTAKKISGELKELQYDNLISKTDIGAVFVPKYMPKGKDVIKVKDNEFKKVLEEMKEKHKD